MVKFTGTSWPTSRVERPGISTTIRASESTGRAMVAVIFSDPFEAVKVSVVLPASSGVSVSGDENLPDTDWAAFDERGASNILLELFTSIFHSEVLIVFHQTSLRTTGI